jgi:dolichol-phosphate mannosyltransferase
VLAGNGKDDPAQIPQLVRPIIEEGYDYVQGSRFLKGGSYENTPPIRLFLAKTFSMLWHFLTGFPITDASNGFRAYKLSLFKDPRLNIWQNWLNGYEFEYYLHFLVHKLGYKTIEVPVSKIYPPERKNYSKIRPIIDWWKMLRPLIYLKLKIKK